jgi:hypothetical protein
MKNDIMAVLIGTWILVRLSFPIYGGLPCSGHHFERCRLLYFLRDRVQKKLMDNVQDDDSEFSKSSGVKPKYENYWGTALQVGRQRFQFSTGYLSFFT